MSRKQIERMESVGQKNGKAAFTSLPNGQCAAGPVPQSMYETKWAAHQLWAAGERPDCNYGPVLTEQARARLREADHASNESH